MLTRGASRQRSRRRSSSAELASARLPRVEAVEGALHDLWLAGAIADGLAHRLLETLLHEAVEVASRLPDVVDDEMPLGVVRAVGDQPVGPVRREVEHLDDLLVIVEGVVR